MKPDVSGNETTDQRMIVYCHCATVLQLDSMIVYCYCASV